MKYYDVVSGRKVIGQDKKRWTNVGVAFEGDLTEPQRIF